MRILEKGIDVICVFYQKDVPIPRKFKITYLTGEARTVIVDLVKGFDRITPLGLYTILYYCQSEVEDRIIDYELKYFVKDMKWQLYRVVNM